MILNKMDICQELGNSDDLQKCRDFLELFTEMSNILQNLSLVNKGGDVIKQKVGNIKLGKSSGGNGNQQVKNDKKKPPSNEAGKSHKDGN